MRFSFGALGRFFGMASQGNFPSSPYRTEPLLRGKPLSMRDLLSLRNSSLDRFAAKIKRPTYERNGIGSGVVHFGVEAFNRSHLAVYLDDLLCLGEQAVGRKRDRPA
jgi:hypothetical protein